jgi:prophage antirepressor-like protein
MEKQNAIKLFDSKKVRVHWDDENEKWYFSIVDVVEILTDSPNANNYWKVLKHRLKKEGSELVTNCNQLKMLSSDGKYYKTDVADTEQLLRLIQSIPSPKAEPFKLWLAKVGSERIDEIEDPEKGKSQGQYDHRDVISSSSEFINSMHSTSKYYLVFFM